VRSFSLIGLLAVALIVIFGVRAELKSSVGGTSDGGATLNSSQIAQAQAICQSTFTPPLARFPPGAGDSSLQTAAQQAGAQVEPMLNRLDPVVDGAGTGHAFMTAYRDLFGALAGFPDTGGTAAEANVTRIEGEVSTQALELGIPACAPN
jgi:hypothetical protein